MRLALVLSRSSRISCSSQSLSAFNAAFHPSIHSPLFKPSTSLPATRLTMKASGSFSLSSASSSRRLAGLVNSDVPDAQRVSSSSSSMNGLPVDENTLRAREGKGVRR